MARICIIRQFHLEDDPRLRREVQALIGAGHRVDLICMRHPGQAPVERLGALTMHRLPMAHRRGGIRRYMLEYGGFLAMAAVYVAAIDIRVRFDLVQVNTVPDSLVFAAIGPRLRGAPVLLDLHECMPEFFASKFGTSVRHPAVRALARIEQASIRFASAAVTCTDQMKEAFVSRGARASRITVVMNSSDESTFDPARFTASQPRESGAFSLVSHGTLEERYGLDTIIRAVSRLRTDIPCLSLEIYGHGSYEHELRRMVDELDLARHVTFHGFVPMDELVSGIIEADAGVVAMKKDAFRDLTHCNKMFDLITMRRPVICSRTASVMAYFPSGSLKYFDADDDADLARAITDLYRAPDERWSLVEHASRRNESYRWPRQRELYLRAVDAAIDRRSPTNLLDRPVDTESRREKVSRKLRSGAALRGLVR